MFTQHVDVPWWPQNGLPRWSQSVVFSGQCVAQFHRIRLPQRAVSSSKTNRTKLFYCRPSPPPVTKWRGVYWNHCVRLYVCQNFVGTISSESLNFLYPNLVRRCIIMSQDIIWKDCCTNFKVKVTMRVYVIKMWPFLLYFLNLWAFCNPS